MRLDTNGSNWVALGGTSCPRVRFGPVGFPAAFGWFKTQLRSRVIEVNSFLSFGNFPTPSSDIVRIRSMTQTH